MLVGCATAASLFPFVGTIVYMIVRPPEFLDDVRLRELEMTAAEARLAQLDYQLCPHCDYEVKTDYLRCPSCMRKLKERCTRARSRSTRRGASARTARPRRARRRRPRRAAGAARQTTDQATVAAEAPSPSRAGEPSSRPADAGTRRDVSARRRR